MKRYLECKVLSNKQIAPDVYDMLLDAPDMARESKAGQFVNVYLGRGEHLLPRPLSICGTDAEAGTLRIVYRAAGKGTDIMAQTAPGASFMIAAPLGNEFKIYPAMQRFCLVGGGIGTPPMLALAREILRKKPDADITVVLGFRNADAAILADEFTALGAGVSVHIATDDGSMGLRGNVVALMNELGKVYDGIYACGPNIMLKFVAQWAAEQHLRCFVSMEERMACGLGACVGCAVKIKTDDGWLYKKVCKDGPVFDAREVVWE